MYLMLHVICIVGLLCNQSLRGQEAPKAGQAAVEVAREPLAMPPVVMPPTQDQVPPTPLPASAPQSSAAGAPQMQPIVPIAKPESLPVSPQAVPAPSASPGDQKIKTLSSAPSDTPQEKKIPVLKSPPTPAQVQQPVMPVPVPERPAAPELPVAPVQQSQSPTPTPTAPQQPEGLKELGEMIKMMQSKDKAQVEPSAQEVSPASAKQAAPVAQKPELEEIRGINTVDLDEPRGNWLFKRIWWERAEQKYEKIRQLVEKLGDSRMEFFEKRKQIDKQVTEFYHDIGLDQGTLKTTIDQLIAQLNKERDQDGILSLEDREILQKLTDSKKDVEQLQTYIEMIGKLDHQFDVSQDTLLEQMNAIRRYESQAWDNFKEIARVLSDTKARELYYGMDVAFSNIQEVQEYLQEPFREHVDHIVAMMVTHIQFIKDAVNKLKESGIDLAAQLESKENTEAVVISPDEQEEQEPEEPQGWVSWTISSISTGFSVMWDYVKSVITWPYRKLVGSPSQEEYEQEETDESESHETEVPGTAESGESA